MAAQISFIVLGRPAPQGSMKAFIVKGKPRLVSQLKTTMPFRQQVGWMAVDARGKAGYNGIVFPKEVALSASVEFYFSPPVKMPKGRTLPTVPPDVDKLSRGVFDAIRGILYVDDSQIVNLYAKKRYGTPERAEITISAVI